MLRAIAFASLVSLAATSASFWNENGGRSVRHHYGDSEGRYGRDSWAGRGHYGGGKDDDDDDDGDSYRKYRQYGGRHGHKDDEDGGDDDRYKWQPSSGGKHSHHKYGKDWESGWDWDDDNKHGRDKESKRGDKDSDVPSSGTGHGWKHSYGDKDGDRSKTHYGWDGDNDNERDDDDGKKASGDHHGKDSDGKSKHSHRHGKDSNDKSKSDKDSNGEYKHKHDGKDSSGKYGKDRDDWDSDTGKKTERHGKDSDDKPKAGKGWDSYGDNGWDSDRGHGDDDRDSVDKHEGKHHDRDDDWNSDDKPKDKEHGRDDDKHHGHEGEKSDDKPKDKDHGRDSDKHKDKDHGEKSNDKPKDEDHHRDDEWDSGGKHKDKDQGYGDHGGYDDQPDQDHDEPHHGKPTSPEPFAQTLRKDTESFVSDVLSWISDLVGSDAAATLVVDTTFSLTKNGQSTSELRSCGDVDVLKGLFPVIHNSVNHPQDVDLLGQNIQSISWTPGEGCVDDSGNATLETEGGVYASIQITCGAKTLLNVSLASSGSTPTIKSLPVEDSGLYLDVTILEGAITATDAQGSIIGVIKSRHFPENVDSVVKNWTTIVKECAEAQTLEVDGVIGGGWTEYRPDANATGGFQQFVVGYAESFSLAYPPSTGATSNSITEPTVVFATKSGVRGGSSTSPHLISPSLQQIARGVSSGYVTSSLACGQQQSSTGTTGCSSRVVMDELTLFHAVASSTVFVALPQGFHATSGDSSVTTGTVLMGVVVVATFAVIGVAVLTQRRREGYETLVQGK